MSNELEALLQYQQAQKLGQKAYKESLHRGTYPYLQVLDEILTDGMIAGKVDLGIIEVPMERIVGTKTAGRTNAFSSTFMPLLPEESEFALKWRKLCNAHLEEGIREPIRCFEYLGRFYVQEGNKRVSVLKYFEASTIRGQVTRLLPMSSEEDEIKQYYEFLEYYPFTGLYQVTFTLPNGFAALQAALGFESDHIWTEEERSHFLHGFVYFERAYEKVRDNRSRLTTADALLTWLKFYSFDSLIEMSAQDLLKNLQAIRQDIDLDDEHIAVYTESSDDEKLTDKLSLTRLFQSVMPSKLGIAFIHELSPEDSNWIMGHEIGRHHLQKVMGDRLNTQVFLGVGTGAEAEAAMETAIQSGAEVIFTTTAPLIGACRKIAARYPHVKVLNCSVSMPYTGVRTYYSRIYEGKFISGAIAGAVSKSDLIGYIASYPIFGVTAGINAFALGAQLTNPNARIQVKWDCIPGNPLQELIDLGVDYVSTLDVPHPQWEKGQWGAFRILLDGITEPMVSPYWDWGTFYIKLIRSIFNGEWNSAGKEEAISYWWGMPSGVIGLKLAEDLPEGVSLLAKILQQGIIDGSVLPFKRTIFDQTGIMRNDGSSSFTPEELLKMEWFCSNVDGFIPAYETLTPKGQAIVQLQGLHRDEILPEKEGILL